MSSGGTCEISKACTVADAIDNDQCETSGAAQMPQCVQGYLEAWLLEGRGKPFHTVENAIHNCNFN